MTTSLSKEVYVRRLNFKCKVDIHEAWIEGSEKDLADVSNILRENTAQTTDLEMVLMAPELRIWNGIFKRPWKLDIPFKRNTGIL